MFSNIRNDYPAIFWVVIDATQGVDPPGFKSRICWRNGSDQKIFQLNGFEFLLERKARG